MDKFPRKGAREYAGNKDHAFRSGERGDWSQVHAGGAAEGVQLYAGKADNKKNCRKWASSPAKSSIELQLKTVGRLKSRAGWILLSKTEKM